MRQKYNNICCLYTIKHFKDLTVGEFYEIEVEDFDDTIESLNVRLDAYENQTKPLIEFYEKLGLCKEVNGLQNIDDVFNDIQKILDEVK